MISKSYIMMCLYLRIIIRLFWIPLFIFLFYLINFLFVFDWIWFNTWKNTRILINTKERSRESFYPCKLLLLVSVAKTEDEQARRRKKQVVAVQTSTIHCPHAYLILCYRETLNDSEKVSTTAHLILYSRWLKGMSYFSNYRSNSGSIIWEK